MNISRQTWEARRAQTAANGGVAPTAVHNRSTYRTWGCRCDTCRIAVADEAWRRRRRSLDRVAAAGGAVPAGVTHGAHAHSYYGCRCQVCVAGVREVAAARRSRRQAANAEPPQHGSSGYTNYGCRCEVCATDHSAKLRLRRAAQRQRRKR